jgi:hypothetical protein
VKFIAFGYRGYYPGGGCGDCVGVFDSLDEANEAIEKHQLGEVLEIPSLLVHHPNRDGHKTPCDLEEYAKL